MTPGAPRYAVVTPARNDVDGLVRLGDSLASQGVAPSAWLIVENGSTDATAEVAAALAERYAWVDVLTIASKSTPNRAAPIVAAFQTALRKLRADPPDVVFKIDADVSFAADHMQSILSAFDSDPRLGIASGIAYEEDSAGVWRQRHGTGPGVWGACRAYRWACLEAVQPLEERMGWDTIDLVAASVRGWTARLLPTVPFRHHRPEGIRDGAAFARWCAQGRAAHYMGYRVSYVLAKTVFRMLRQPAAAGVAVGYLDASWRREPRYRDASVLAWVRHEQRWRKLPQRVREAFRPRLPLDSGSTAG